MNTKTPAVVTTITAIVADVRALASAYRAQEGAAAKAAAAVRTIGAKVKADQVDSAAAQIKTALEPVLSIGSLKVEVSRIKGVLRAMAGGFKPEEGESLRAMYERGGKGNGRQKSGARHDKPESKKAAKPDAQTPAANLADMSDDTRRETLALAIWGYCEPALIAAIEVAETHASEFMEWAAKLQQKAATDSPVKSTKPATKTTTKRATKQRKAA